MKKLIVCFLLLCELLVVTANVAQAQRRGRRGRAMVVRPSKARYARAPMFRDYYKPPRRTQFHYAPSYHAYYNRAPYRPRTRYYRRPAKRLVIASVHTKS